MEGLGLYRIHVCTHAAMMYMYELQFIYQLHITCCCVQLMQAFYTSYRIQIGPDGSFALPSSFLYLMTLCSCNGSQNQIQSREHDD